MTALVSGNCDGRDGVGRALLGLTMTPAARLTPEQDYVPPSPYRRNYQPSAGTGGWLAQVRDTREDLEAAGDNSYDLSRMARADLLAAGARGRQHGRQALASARLIKEATA